MGAELPEAIMSLISLAFTAVRLNRLKDMVKRQYSLADRQTVLAETLYGLQKVLRSSDGVFFGITNSSPIYEQRYDCATLRANVNTARELIGTRQNALKGTDAYHHGRMRNIVQTTADSMVILSMPKKLDAYRFEDALTDTSQERRFANLVDSIATRFFSPAGVYASLGAFYGQMADGMAKSATIGLEDTAYHFGRVYESFRDPKSKQIKSASDTFDRMSEQRRLEIASGRHHRPTEIARRELQIASGDATRDRVLPTLTPTQQAVPYKSTWDSTAEE